MQNKVTFYPQLQVNKHPFHFAAHSKLIDVIVAAFFYSDATVGVPICQPAEPQPSLRHSKHVSNTLRHPGSPQPPHPKILFPPPGLTSAWWHVGASSSAPNYSLAKSSTETT